MRGAEALSLPRALPRPAPAGPRTSKPIRVEATGRRLVAFGALAAYATGAWAGLLADPPAARIIFALCIALACAGGLAAIGRARP